jgi:hypothetical protein
MRWQPPNVPAHTPAQTGEGHLQKQRRSKGVLSLKERLALYAKQIRQRAAILPAGIERDALLEKARQADPGSNPDEANSKEKHSR